MWVKFQIFLNFQFGVKYKISISAYLDRDAVVELQPGDAPQFESNPESVAQSEVLRHFVEVLPDVTRQPVVADIPGCDEDVRLEEVAQSSPARSEGERSVEVEPAGPVDSPAERVPVPAGSDTADIKPSHTQRASWSGRELIRIIFV